MKGVFYSCSTTLYGAPRSLLNLIQGLLQLQKGIKIYVVVPGNGALTDELRKLPIQLIVLPFYKWIYKSSLFNIKKRNNVFLAIVWFYKNLIQKLVLNLFYLPTHVYKIGRIKPDFIYVNASMSPMGIVVAKILKIKCIWHHREPLNDPNTDFFIEWNKKLTTIVLSWPDARIYNSRFLLGMFWNLGPYQGKSYIVHNGVPDASPHVRASRGEIVFGMVGKIEPGLRKGQAEIIDCFKGLRNRNIRLHIYGGGEASYINLLKENADGNKIVFKGFKSIDEIYNEIDYLIMNSRNESFGRVVVEGYSYGVPVLALRSGALPEIVEDGKTGFIYQNREELLNLIERSAVIRNKADYSRLRDLCIKKFKDNFTISIYSQNILKILKEQIR